MDPIAIALQFALTVLGAVLPTAIYVILLWMLDRYEKEPLPLLALAFIWGAGPAVLASLFGEILLGIPVTALIGETATGEIVEGVIIAPLLEEAFKAVALLAFLLVVYREFDDPLDGIVYGGMIGFGFAMTEDILYFAGAFAEGGLAHGIVVIVLRTTVFGLNHAFFTAITGMALGVARLSRGYSQRFIIPFLGLTGAVTAHALHNLGTAMAQQTLCLSFLAAVAADWGGIVVLLMVVLAILERERRWIVSEMSEEVQAGILSPEEFLLVRSHIGRVAGMAHAYVSGGAPALHRQRALVRLATELAFKKHQLRRMGDENHTQREIERLRGQIVAIRGR